MAPTLALRLLRVAGNVIVAAVVLVCTLLLAVRFVVFPALDDYRDRIAATLTRQLGQPVTIAGITGSWDGWNPRLAIAGFAIHDRQRPDAPPVLSLPQVDLVIAWTSLLAFDVRLKELAIERPELFIRRDTAGRLHVAGIEIDPDTQSDDAGFTDWLLRQRLIVVRDALVSWNDELRRSPQLVLDHVMFRLERGFNVHRFGLTGSPPADLASPLDFRGEVGAASFKDWRQAKGRFFVRLDFADVGLWREWVPLLQPVEAGQGALRLWFDFAEGKPTNMVADLELTDVRAGPREPARARAHPCRRPRRVRERTRQARDHDHRLHLHDRRRRDSRADGDDGEHDAGRAGRHHRRPGRVRPPRGGAAVVRRRAPAAVRHVAP